MRTLVLAAVAALELLVAHLALVVLRVNVLAFDLQILANDGLLAHRARVLFRIWTRKKAIRTTKKQKTTGKTGMEGNVLDFFRISRKVEWWLTVVDVALREARRAERICMAKALNTTHSTHAL